MCEGSMTFDPVSSRQLQNKNIGVHICRRPILKLQTKPHHCIEHHQNLTSAG